MTNRDQRRSAFGWVAAGRLIVLFAGVVVAAGCTSTELNRVSGCEKLQPTQDVAEIVNTASPGQAFCFTPGVYHLSESMTPGAGQSLVGTGQAVLTGGRTLTTWKAAGGVWKARVEVITATRNHAAAGGVTLANPQSQFNEDLFMDGSWLVKLGVKLHGHVYGRRLSALARGQYFVDYDAHTVSVGSDPTGHLLEMNLGVDGDVIAGGQPDVTVRDLVVEMGRERGIRSGAGWRIHDVTARLNATTGITVINGSWVTNSTMARNGQYGITGQGNGVVVTGSDVGFNNAARMEATGDVCNATGGSKFVRTVNLLVEENRFHDNGCNALWVDIDNINPLISRNTVIRNAGHGIDIEISYAATIDRNVVRDNSGWGILVRSSARTTISHNHVSGGRGGIFLIAHPRDDHPSRLGPHTTEGTQVFRNTIRVTGPHERVGGRTTSGPEMFTSSSSNRFYDNIWQLSSARSETFVWNGTQWDANGWRSQRQDEHGVFTTTTGHLR